MNNIHAQIALKATAVTALSYVAKYFKVAEKIKVNHLESATASLVSNAALSFYKKEDFSGYKPYTKALINSGLQYIAENVLHEKFANKPLINDLFLPAIVEIIGSYGFDGLDSYLSAVSAVSA